jgi:hypothetical protein
MKPGTARKTHGDYIRRLLDSPYQDAFDEQSSVGSLLKNIPLLVDVPTTDCVDNICMKSEHLFSSESSTPSIGANMSIGTKGRNLTPSRRATITI